MSCLVIRLNFDVNDTNIPVLGGTIFKMSSEVSGLTKMSISGGGVFFESVDGSEIFSTDSAGKNKKNRIDISSSSTFYIDTRQGKNILLGNKYDIQSIDCYLDGLKSLNLEINFEEFKFSNKLNSIIITSVNIVNGDISQFKCLTSLENIIFFKSNISGDISAFSSLINLKNISFNNTQITGDISALQYCKNLQIINIDGTTISGDISVLNDLPNVKTFFDYSGSDFTGDFFGVLASRDWNILQCNGSFNYSTKDFIGRTYKTIGAIKCVCDNLDNFLNDFSKVNSTDSASLIMTGTRTTASDDAISTLKSKGYSVSVPAASNVNTISLMSVNDNYEIYRIAFKDKDLIIPPVTLQIYPAAGVTVKEFQTLDEANAFISENNLSTEVE